MSLDFDLKGVENLDELWPKPEQGGGPMDSKLELLIFATMTLGVNEISDKNLADVWVRLTFAQKVLGLYETITYADVKRRVGIRTNVTKETTAQWVKRIYESHTRDVQYDLRRAQKKEGA